MASKYLVVGVDYGTTFSGVSYVFSDKKTVDDVDVLSQWGAGSIHEKQVPSRIAYSPQQAWGYDVEPGQVAYCWTKLLLDAVAPRTNHDDECLRKIWGPGFKMTPPGKSAEDVVRDYLALLYKHTMTDLGRKLSKAVLKITPIHFWFTHPAIWSVRAQNATRRAATNAGFSSRPGDEVYLIKEPEAAAIACLSRHFANGPSALIKPKQAILVCDCGGGTVDLASYEILKDYPELELRQACVNEGGKCGSTTIDRAFMELMERRFGPKYLHLPDKKRGPNSKFMTDFESAKRDFRGLQSARKHRLRLKIEAEDSKFYDGEDNEVILTSTDMLELFDPVVQKIIALVKAQAQATEDRGLAIRVIALVGGFGESRYLYDRIRGEWETQGITTINPPRSWEAVCLGAALRGLKGHVVGEKQARSHIGIASSRVFKDGVDSESDAYYDPIRQTKFADGYVEWLLNKGDTVTRTSRKQHAHYALWWTGNNKTFECNLYESAQTTPPSRADHPSITKIGTIQFDIHGVDFSMFKNVEYHGARVYQLYYELVTIPEDDLGYMHFRAEAQGKELGTTRLVF